MSPPYPAFSVLFCPLSPQPPSPVGKGEIQGYFMQGASPLASPRLDGARHWLSLPYRCLGGGGITRRERFLSVLRKPIGSAAGVPGAKPSAKSTKISPFPPGRGSGGWGQKSKLKAGAAGGKASKPPAGCHSGKVSQCRKRSNPGDARGEAPCIRKLKISPFPPGRGSGG